MVDYIAIRKAALEERQRQRERKAARRKPHVVYVVVRETDGVELLRTESLYAAKQMNTRYRRTYILTQESQQKNL